MPVTWHRAADAAKRRSVNFCPDIRTGMSQDHRYHADRDRTDRHRSVRAGDARTGPARPQAHPVKGRYDTETDVLSVRFTEAEVVESREIRPGIVVGYDAAGDIAGIEILDASSEPLASDQDLRRLAVAA